MIQKATEQPSLYRKSNAWTKKPSFAMLFTFFLMIALIVLHAFIVDTIARIANPILSFLLAFNYVLLVAVSVDYFILLTLDPVDPRLLTNDYDESERDKKLLVYCTACNKNVHVYSYHCRTCGRCAEQFDHHCIFLNNCIGKQNYANFFRILLTLSSYLVVNIGEGVWVAVVMSDRSRWLGVSLAVLSGLIIPEVIGLMGFHCYISICLYKTTLEVIRGELTAEDQKNMKDYSPKQPPPIKQEGLKKMDSETSLNREENF